VKRITGRTSNKLDDAIIAAVKAPSYWLLLVIAFQFAIGRLDFINQLTEFPFDELYFVLYLLVGFAIVWRLITNVEKWYLREVAPGTATTLDEQLLPFGRRVALIVISAIAVIMLFSHFQIEVGGLVATLGVGSLALALAAQAALADTVSGFVIMIDRPYRIGDRIELLDLDTWGDVVDIGLRSTRIRTRDNRMVIVPNSVISKSLIVNHTFPDPNYRIEIEIGVAYGVDIEQVRELLIEAVSGVDGVSKSMPVEALFLQFGGSALIFRIRWWLDSYVDTRRMFDKVNTAMYNKLAEAGIEIPFPQMDVHLRSANGVQGITAKKA
jgi:small-conductance mechanosensitive channel